MSSSEEESSDEEEDYIELDEFENEISFSDEEYF